MDTGVVEVWLRWRQRCVDKGVWTKVCGLRYVDKGVNQSEFYGVGRQGHVSMRVLLLFSKGSMDKWKKASMPGNGVPVAFSCLSSRTLLRVLLSPNRLGCVILPTICHINAMTSTQYVAAQVTQRTPKCPQVHTLRRYKCSHKTHIYTRCYQTVRIMWTGNLPHTLCSHPAATHTRLQQDHEKTTYFSLHQPSISSNNKIIHIIIITATT